MEDFIFALFCIGVFTIFCLILRRYEVKITGNQNAVEDKEFSFSKAVPGGPDCYSITAFGDSSREYYDRVNELHKQLRENDHTRYSSLS